MPQMDLCINSDQWQTLNIPNKELIFLSRDQARDAMHSSVGRRTTTALELINHGEDACSPFAHDWRPSKRPASQAHLHR
jgi:hypothetical protein